MTTNPRTIISEVGQWADQQPWGLGDKPAHAPDYGCLEEFGEMMHCILKNIQKIRGFEVPEFFHAQVTDAIGDFMVYLSHWCHMHKCYYTFREKSQVSDLEEIRPTLGQLLIALSQMLVFSKEILNAPSVAGSIATRVAQLMQAIAQFVGTDIEVALAVTWDKVKQRNWNKDKMKGGETATSIQQAKADVENL